MRIICLGVYILALAAAAASLRFDDPEGLLGRRECRHGLCRADQITAAIELEGEGGSLRGPELFGSLLAIRPADAYSWAAQGVFLNSKKEYALEAQRAMEKAVELAPAVAPIRMRKVNYCLEKGDRDCVLSDGRAVMGLSGRFDEVLYTYYRMLGVEPGEVLQSGIPGEIRARRGWLVHWARQGEPVGGVEGIWRQLRREGLVDEGVPEGVGGAGGGGRGAGGPGRDYEGTLPGAADAGELVTNGGFGRAPAKVAFDWSLGEVKGVKLRREKGLEVEFGGEENVRWGHVRQRIRVEPGARYRLGVEVEHEELTTDQGPRMRVWAVDGGRGVLAETAMWRGSGARRREEVEFVTPAGTRWVEVGLAREASQKFDSKIAGRLRVIGVSLRRR
ncbi:MAG: hypothetical protein M9913_05925 [Bryobacteraceae bacterium]|nr:hypothetical protein [Bryobacteraceae bacterium]